MTNIVSAQSWYVGIKGGGAYSKVVDKDFSSLLWSGAGAGGAVIIGCRKGSATHELNAGYIYGKLSNAAAPANDVTQSSVDIRYTNQYSISRENARLKWQAGGQAGFMRTARNFEGFINKRRSYEKLFFAGPVAQAIITLSDDSHSNWSISDRIQLPLVSIFSRSFAADNTDWHFSGPFADCFNMSNVLALHRNWGDRYQVSLSYDWNYYRIQTDNEVSRSMHQLTIVYSIKL